MLFVQGPFEKGQSMNYFEKMKGVTKSPPQVDLKEMVWSWIGSFAGIGAIAFFYYFLLDDSEILVLKV